MNISANFFATCPKNLEGLLEEELISLGAKKTKQTVAGVSFAGNLSLAYRVCLWSRLANRVLLPLMTFNAEDANALYDGVRKVKWFEHFRPDNSLAVDFSGVSFTIKNSHFGALKVKDAIIDQMREHTGKRPNIDKKHPDIRINVYLDNIVATVSLDLSGESLHRRGYRTCPGPAPLKENLAAAILYRSKWPEFAKAGKSLLDPMCGSGTILIEAAMIAEDYAPGFLRKSFGFSRWVHHDGKVWEDLLQEACSRRAQGAKNFREFIYGWDMDTNAITMVKIHIKKAGLEKRIKVEEAEIKSITPFKLHFAGPGIIVTNPPYGKRLHEINELSWLYQDFGEMLRKNFLNWEVAMLTGNPDLGKTMGIRSYKQYNFFNGTIPCKLLLFKIIPDMFWREYKGKRQVLV